MIEINQDSKTITLTDDLDPCRGSLEFPLRGWQICPHCNHPLRAMIDTVVPVDIHRFGHIPQDLAYRRAGKSNNRYEVTPVAHRRIQAALLLEMKWHDRTAVIGNGWQCSHHAIACVPAYLAVQRVLDNLYPDRPPHLIQRELTWDMLRAHIATPSVCDGPRPEIVDDPMGFFSPILLAYLTDYQASTYALFKPFLVMG